MISFVKCPFCAGHESISAEAADVLQRMIDNWLSYNDMNLPRDIELSNIRNAIQNRQERAAAIDPLLG